MRRITSMNLEIKAQRSSQCALGCPFVTFLKNNTLKLMETDHLKLHSPNKHTQFFMLISPYEKKSVPNELSESILSFHDRIKSINLNQQRKRIVNLIKYTIFTLNKSIMRWNAEHPDLEQIYLNITIAFVYGDQLNMLNFGNNIVYMYRDGDLSSFNGPQLDNEMHYSLNTGQAGRSEYMLFKEEVPPLGKAGFESKQVLTLFKLSHRLLKDDRLVVLTENSIDIPSLRVNVNLYEQTVTNKALIKLIGKSKTPDTPNYAWAILEFSEIQETLQTVRYAMFNTPKGIFSCLLLILTLVLPIIYDTEIEEEYTPVHKFATPAITSYITILDTDTSNSLDLIPDLSMSTAQSSQSEPVSKTPDEIIAEARLRWNHLHLSGYKHLEIDPYGLFSSDASNIYSSLSRRYYDSSSQEDIIAFMNPHLQGDVSEIQVVLLPTFTIPRTTNLDLYQISTLYYDTTRHAEFLRESNGEDTLTPPFTDPITVGPITD